MELTNAMVRASVNKAVELGLLTRNAAQNEYDWDLIGRIVGAALAVNAKACSTPDPDRKREFRDVPGMP